MIIIIIIIVIISIIIIISIVVILAQAHSTQATIEIDLLFDGIDYTCSLSRSALRSSAWSTCGTPWALCRSACVTVASRSGMCTRWSTSMYIASPPSLGLRGWRRGPVFPVCPQQSELFFRFKAETESERRCPSREDEAGCRRRQTICLWHWIQNNIFFKIKPIGHSYSAKKNWGNFRLHTGGSLANFFSEHF